MRSAFEWILVLGSLIGFGVLGWFTAHTGETRIPNLEAQLERKAERALLELGAGWANVRMEGQTAVLTGEAPTRKALDAVEDAVLASAPIDVPGLPASFGAKGGFWFGGVVAVDNRASVAEAISPYKIVAEKTPEGGINIFGLAPDNASIDRVFEAAEIHFPNQVTVELEVAAGVPGPEWVRTFEELLPLVAQEGVRSAVLEDRDVQFMIERPDVAESGETSETETETTEPDFVLPGLPDGYVGSVSYVSNATEGADTEGGSLAGDGLAEEG